MKKILKYSVCFLIAFTSCFPSLVNFETLKAESSENPDKDLFTATAGDKIAADYDLYDFDENGNLIEKVNESYLDSNESDVYSDHSLQVLDLNVKSALYNTNYVDENGKSGYINGNYGGDAAFLGYDSNGNAKFMISGSVGYLPSTQSYYKNDGSVDYSMKNYNLVSYDSAKSISHYIVQGGNLYHKFSKKVTEENSYSTVNYGVAPSYLASGIKYYSYDGNYFYTDYEIMINDYKADSRVNSVNSNSAYHNYFQFLSLRSKTNYTADELNTFLFNNTNSSSVLRNTGEYFIKYQNLYGVNAMLALSHAIIESGWGMSDYAVKRNNIFGIGAGDANPDNATYYSSVEKCIETYMDLYMSETYLDPNDAMGRGAGPSYGNKATGINFKYASDPYAGEKIAAIALSIDSANKDKNYYAIAVKQNTTSLNVKKSTNNASQTLYSTGTYRSFPFVLIGAEYGEMVNGSNLWYKIQSDSTLLADRSNIIQDSGEYSFDTNYAYIPAGLITVSNIGANELIPGIMSIDSPVLNQSYTNELIVQGWSVSDEKIENMQIFIDGKVVDEQIDRYVRNDVYEVIGDNYGGRNNNLLPAFRSVIDLLNYEIGKHTVTVKAYDVSGKILISSNRDFYVKEKYKTLLSLDEPSTNVDVIDTLKVQGWFVSEDTNKKIKISIDNNKVNSNIVYYERQDVYDFIGTEYGGKSNNLKPAYVANVNVSNLSAGNHVLRVEVVGSDNTTLKYKEVAFTKTKVTYVGRVAIDEPNENSEVFKGSILASGWINSNDANSEVKVEVDGKVITNAAERTIRSDATAISEDYGGVATNAKAGWQTAIDTTSIKTGNHALKVSIISATGEMIASKSIAFKVAGYKGRVAIDEPKANSEVSKGSISASGWINSNDANSKVKVEVDGKVITNAAERTIRSDATAISEDYGGATINAKAGWQTAIDTTSMKTGNHTLKVSIISATGEMIASKSIAFKVAGYKGRVAIDEPNENSEVSKGSIRASGWINSNDANSKVKVEVDGKVITNAAERTIRSDATAISEDYGGVATNAKAGWQTAIDTTSMKTGNHTLKVSIISATGEMIASKSIAFKVAGYKARIAIDGIENGDIIFDKASNSIKLKGWLNSEDKHSRVQIKLNDKVVIENADRHVRSDATAISGEYGGSDANQFAGYAANIDNLLQGTNTIQANVISSNNELLASKEITFSYTKYNAKLSVDTLVNNTKYENELLIEGWRACESESNSIKIKIDGVPVYEAVESYDRQDVYDFIKNENGKYGSIEQNRKPAFKCKLNLNNYSKGTHTITIEVLDDLNKVVNKKVYEVYFI